MSIYSLTTTDEVVYNNCTTIPKDVNNVDYQAYLIWLSEGNTPTPLPVPSKATLLTKALIGLNTQYKSNLQEAQLAWLSAAVFDGVTEEEKKVLIQEDITLVKETYLLDKAALKLQYS